MKSSAGTLAAISTMFGLALASIFYDGGLWMIGKIYCAIVCMGHFLNATNLLKK